MSRSGLIPNLVRTTEGARDFGRVTLQSVVEAKAKAGQVKTDTTSYAQKNGGVSVKLGRVERHTGK